ncbi:KN motif and ankyrin repeat domain-containing protein 3-like [Conger conger]|uniref:KN motif and ankyrin repeat domain-containing protein 3-like n=1 Tax=Conger conger TaxID=82655 RepID=UPI002A5A5EC6|nr:KN motif and ankyrin repeat domain-containing protein 3-like [Conger conger]
MESSESTQTPLARGGSYSVPTPYGYQLDLDFLRLVEEMESGCRVWGAQGRLSSRGPRRGRVGSRVEQTLVEVRQRLQRSRSNSLAELGRFDSPNVSPRNASDPEFCQSHTSSPLSSAYSPACSDGPLSSQDSGVGGDLAELAGGVGRTGGILGGDLAELAGGVGWTGGIFDQGSGGRFAQGRWPVAEGDDRPLGNSQDAAMETEHVQMCEVGVETDESWERELEALRHTVETQRHLIHLLEHQLNRTQEAQEVLRAQQAQEVLRAQQAQEVETELCPGCSKVHGVLGEGAGRVHQSTQTDSQGETPPAALTSRGSQWEERSIPAGKNRDVTSTPAAGLLKSIMKRPGGDRASGHRKCLQFVGILNGGYESTSSEEEEDEDEDSSSGASDSSEGAVESQKERSIDPPSGNESESEEEKEKFELSVEMREACLILKSHLDDDISAVYEDNVLSSSQTVEQEWFRVCGSKAAKPAHVSGFLTAFSQLFPGLLECVVNMADLHGNTALHYSLSWSNFTVVCVLLDTGVCDVDQRNKAGYTPLMLAALSTPRTAENMQVVRRLYSQGNVNAKANQTGQTALLLAVCRRQVQMAWALLDCGADVNAQDGVGSSALMYACQQGPAHMVSLLLQHPHCDITLRNNDGETALCIALAASRSDIVVLLYTHMNRKVHPTAPALGSNPSTAESKVQQPENQTTIQGKLIR